MSERSMAKMNKSLSTASSSALLDAKFYVIRTSLSQQVQTEGEPCPVMGSVQQCARQSAVSR